MTTHDLHTLVRPPLPRTVKLWAALSLSVYLLYAGYAIATDRALFADGAYFYVHIVSSAEPWTYFDDSKHIRLFVNLVNQIPLMALAAAGVTDPAILRTAFNAPLFLGNAALLLALWFFSRRHRSYLVWSYALVAYIATVIPSDIFSINQARLSQTVYWCILFFALTPKTIGRGEGLLIAALMILCFRSHEAIIMFGPLITLAAVAGLRLHQGASAGVRWALAAGGLALMAYAAYWQMSHAVGEQTAGFLASYSGWSISLLYRSPLFFAWSLLALLAVAATGMQSFKGDNRTSRRIMVTYAVICILVALLPLLSYKRLSPSAEFSFRLLIPFGGALLAFAAIADHYWRLTRRSNPKLLVSFAASALLGMSIWQILVTHRWHQFTQLTQGALAQAHAAVISSKDVANHDPAVAQQVMRFRWGWTWPALSMALSDDRHIDAVVAPEEHHEFFFISTEEPDMLHIPFSAIGPRYFDVSQVMRACQGPSSSTRRSCMP